MFITSRRKIRESAEQLLATVGKEADELLRGMEDAEARFEEQATTITSQNETIRLQQEEIDRIAADFQTRIDLQDQEITALRSRLAQKNRDFAVLSRAVGAMVTGARHINAVGVHAFSIIRRDATGDAIVTQLRRNRPSPPSDDDSLQTILKRTQPVPPERAAG